MDVTHVVDGAIADILLRSEKEHKPMTIRKEVSPDIPRALGDPERVRQIIDNLLENAFSYTPDGGEIILRLTRNKDEVQVDVQDNGIGIAPSEQTKIFERFYRGESPLVLSTSGTGLGLSIVKRLVDMHNGRIWLTSTGVAGEGSTFSFTLPAYTPATDRD
jgi:signal transduction histidine kinase